MCIRDSNREGLLHSGGAGNVIVPTEKAGALVIPQAATFEVQDKVFAYKVVDGKAQSAPVQVLSLIHIYPVANSNIRAPEQRTYEKVRSDDCRPQSLYG